MKIGDTVVVLDKKSLRDHNYEKYIGHIGIVDEILESTDAYPYFVIFKSMPPIRFSMSEVRLYLGDDYYYEL